VRYDRVTRYVRYTVFFQRLVGKCDSSVFVIGFRLRRPPRNVYDIIGDFGLIANYRLNDVL
jgi:hypothetical protein